jgi:hypothetical protein
MECILVFATDNFIIELFPQTSQRQKFEEDIWTHCLLYPLSSSFW